MEMPEENGKKGTAPKLEFQMDYQNVKCIISEDFDDEFQAFLEEKENEDKPVQKVYCYTADEEARQMPFCVTAAADWTVGKKYYTNRQGIESYQCILTTGGCGYVETEGKVYTCSPGALLLVGCGIVYALRLQDMSIGKATYTQRFDDKGKAIDPVEKSMDIITPYGRSGDAIQQALKAANA